jgi:hypothetical protein
MSSVKVTRTGSGTNITAIRCYQYETRPVPARLLAEVTAHQRPHQPQKENRLGPTEMAVGDVCGRLSPTSHLVWGYVALTGVAAAVPPRLHPR